MGKKEEERKIKFLRMYANIPLGARNEIVAVVYGIIYTFKDLYKLSKKLDEYAPDLIFNEALKKMEDMEIL